MLNIGDIIYQLFSILVVIFFIVMIVSFFRSSKKRKEQLDRIENKLDKLSGQSTKN
ncbi:hypothetical protein [Bacillus sp. E214]|uniref:hypothetical protein n=1 Tax=Bacillus sp. E214 TaxID=2587156 RepID=UPI001651C5D9|nr:hypothetical protein [Bacillus sp. E214]